MLIYTYYYDPCEEECAWRTQTDCRHLHPILGSGRRLLTGRRRRRRRQTENGGRKLFIVALPSSSSFVGAEAPRGLSLFLPWSLQVTHPRVGWGGNWNAVACEPASSSSSSPLCLSLPPPPGGAAIVPHFGGVVAHPSMLLVFSPCSSKPSGDCTDWTARTRSSRWCCSSLPRQSTLGLSRIFCRLPPQAPFLRVVASLLQRMMILYYYYSFLPPWAAYYTHSTRLQASLENVYCAPHSFLGRSCSWPLQVPWTHRE